MNHHKPVILSEAQRSRSTCGCSSLLLRNAEFCSNPHFPAGSAAGLSRAMRPLGPTTKGSERAFQLPLSSGCQVLPSSRLKSEPLVPTVIQSLRLSDHCTALRKPWGGVVEAVQCSPLSSDHAVVPVLSLGLV